ncbi:MAG: PfkB family carbohydrate kinase [Planctomycetaceae bacterium]|nr:PfkB family carbohydrate kinase [Planctomycetaceae bacterium]
MQERKPKIVVLGPAFVDMAIRCEGHPTPELPVEGSGFTCIPTGAGLNEAIQAALCGCETYLLARVGQDCFGEMIRQHLRRYEVLTDLLYATQAMSTGIIVTLVSSDGENFACRSQGANRVMSRDEIEYAAAEQQISTSDAILVNDSIATPAAVAAIRLAEIHKTKIVVNAKMSEPGRQAVSALNWPVEFYNADVIVMRFKGIMCGSELGAGGEGELKFVATELIARGAQCVVISLGWHGALLADRQGLRRIAGIPGEVVDQNGCDAAFTGALAACLASGDTPQRAVRFAVAAESIMRGRFGMHESFPKKEDILTILQAQPD